MIPHLVQYQGSKRNIANNIIKYFPKTVNRLIEPFCGTAAISIAAAQRGISYRFILNDINKPLIQLLELCITSPEDLVTKYTSIWQKQFNLGTNNISYFYEIRDRFNQNQDPSDLLFLLARVVKGAVRYNNKGEMNQSCDKRRYGTKPAQIARNAHAISSLLKGKVDFHCMDFREVLKLAQPGDLVYMDPPYQGTSGTKDNRYMNGVSYDDFTEPLKMLNSREIDFIISYDGITGNKKHGKDLPSDLELTHLLIDAGDSAQATLLGRKETTLESLYLSKNLHSNNVNEFSQLNLSL
jgi:DNA adenine methylase